MTKFNIYVCAGTPRTWERQRPRMQMFSVRKGTWVHHTFLSCKWSQVSWGLLRVTLLVNRSLSCPIDQSKAVCSDNCLLWTRPLIQDLPGSSGMGKKFVIWRVDVFCAFGDFPPEDRAPPLVRISWPLPNGYTFKFLNIWIYSPLLDKMLLKLGIIFLLIQWRCSITVANGLDLVLVSRHSLSCN